MLFEMRWIKSGGTMFCEVALSSLRRVLAYESPLKIMKNAFYFILKALFVLKIFEFLSWLFVHVRLRLD